VPVNPRATTAPAPATAPSIAPADEAKIYATAMEPYLKAHKLLSTDKVEGVGALFDQTTTALAPLMSAGDIGTQVQKLNDAVQKSKSQPIDVTRNNFRDVSNAMIAIGKAVGMPGSSRIVNVFRCPMAKALWLQEGDRTENPYYGSEMYECGSAVEPLPKAKETIAPTKRMTATSEQVLAVPRSAVIDTGDKKVAYVESSPGVYDMRAVTLGAPAGDWFPVIDGLQTGERVVTVGAFLIDAENRLNPTVTAAAPPQAPAVHKH
jgi:hypothetical protein